MANPSCEGHSLTAVSVCHSAFRRSLASSARSNLECGDASPLCSDRGTTGRRGRAVRGFCVLRAWVGPKGGGFGDVRLPTVCDAPGPTAKRRCIAALQNAGKLRNIKTCALGECAITAGNCRTHDQGTAADQIPLPIFTGRKYHPKNPVFLDYPLSRANLPIAQFAAST